MQNYNTIVENKELKDMIEEFSKDREAFRSINSLIEERYRQSEEKSNIFSKNLNKQINEIVNKGEKSIADIEKTNIFFKKLTKNHNNEKKKQNDINKQAEEQNLLLKEKLEKESKIRKQYFQETTSEISSILNKLNTNLENQKSKNRRIEIMVAVSILLGIIAIIT